MACMKQHMRVSADRYSRGSRTIAAGHKQPAADLTKPGQTWRALTRLIGGDC